MKIRQSGMPKEEMWSDFFQPEKILKIMGALKSKGDVLDLGCGFGTFSLPAAKMMKGKVYAIDIDPKMIKTVKQKTKAEKIRNIIPTVKDFCSKGTGLKENSVSYVMLFNILHAERPLKILKEAYRVLKPGGKAGIIHWIYSEKTPRGPSLSIRPKPSQCREWAREAGFKIVKPNIALKPYHFGIIAVKP